ncbi:hypothetical protein [Castellaniella sp. GW247-6E4]|uniref:hypothetical protein n=1 Tax=Castellaniella sp. GW247-6E4 TaxID=3140380 RepID=UPI003315B40E
MMERKVNDVGGLQGGPVVPHAPALTLHQKRIDALVMLLSNPKINAFKVDALRRAIEQSTKGEYHKFGYYDKWIRAIRDLLIEQEVLSKNEIEERIELLRLTAAREK